jgi:hypothetical protein
MSDDIERAALELIKLYRSGAAQIARDLAEDFRTEAVVVLRPGCGTAMVGTARHCGTTDNSTGASTGPSDPDRKGYPDVSELRHNFYGKKI